MEVWIDRSGEVIDQMEAGETCADRLFRHVHYYISLFLRQLSSHHVSSRLL